MCEDSDKLTPMFAQYKSIKKNYPDALLFFRMGDFYELFFEDAVTASRELQIALTSRGKSGANSAPMCGVPWHASQSYLAQLIDKGYSIAICEQVEDPKAKKGLVKRAVIQVITPGTSLEESNLGAKNHNYLGAIFCGMHNSCAFAWADISTGQWSGLEFKKQAEMWQWVKKLAPAELLVVDGQQLPPNFSQDNIRLVHQPSINFELKHATEKLLQAQNVKEPAALGLESKPALVRACGAILAYLEQTQIRNPSRLMPFRPLDLGRHLIIDELSEKNLEIFITNSGRKGKGTLRHVVDDTITPMGGRLMEDMLRHPWRDIRIIQKIQDCVTYFYMRDGLRDRLRKILAQIFDIERVIVRISANRCNARDFFSLRQSLINLQTLKDVLLSEPAGNFPPLLKDVIDKTDFLEDCAEFLEKAMVDTLQSVERDYDIFRPGWNAHLDQQIYLLNNGNEKIETLLNEERTRTGLAKLKCGYNRVFGYYFEVGKTKGPLPGHFQRKQSLANSERFTTEELKNLESEILAASEKKQQLESEMFEDLRNHLAQQRERVLQTSDMIAQLDYWQSLAEVGRRKGWVMPTVNENADIHILEGRHPVIEEIIGKANFVPNDFHFDQHRRLCLLTGPNMAGKSTVLRQIALICLLAQMGGMVPASRAELGIVDRLFSRVGASDNLAQGQSTFMVEMMETARILRQASKRSLIILDELGRGTSTWDGMAIAWAVVEDLATRSQGQLRTIFATHYHELTALEDIIPALFTMNIAISKYEGNEIIFLHRLLNGPSDKSYGVEVARLAGVPYPVVQRARDILKTLEQKRRPQTLSAITLPGIADSGGTENVIEELRNLQLSSLSPEDALKKLYALQNLVLNHSQS